MEAALFSIVGALLVAVVIIYYQHRQSRHMMLTQKLEELALAVEEFRQGFAIVLLETTKPKDPRVLSDMSPVQKHLSRASVLARLHFSEFEQQLEELSKPTVEACMLLIELGRAHALAHAVAGDPKSSPEAKAKASGDHQRVREQSIEVLKGVFAPVEVLREAIKRGSDELTEKPGSWI